MAVKLAEMFADLHATGQYRISRTGYYQQHYAHDADEAAEIAALLDGRPAMGTGGAAG
jgi:allantoin racemase